LTLLYFSKKLLFFK